MESCKLQASSTPMIQTRSFGFHHREQCGHSTPAVPLLWFLFLFVHKALKSGCAGRPLAAGPEGAVRCGSSASTAALPAAAPHALQLPGHLQSPRLLCPELMVLKAFGSSEWHITKTVLDRSRQGLFTSKKKTMCLKFRAANVHLWEKV